MNFIIKSEVSNLIDKQLKALESKYSESREVEVIKYDMESVSLNEILEEANTYPMWSEFKLIVCNNANFLTTKGISNSEFENDYDLLEEYIDSASDFSALVFVVGENFDKRKKIYKSLSKSCKIFDLDNFDNNKIVAMVINKLQKDGKQISDRDASYICERLNYNLSLVFNEIEKLTLVVEETIDKKIIDELISRSIEDNIFELTTAVMKCDVSSAYSIYNDLIMNKEEPIAMIAMIANQFRLLLQAKGYSNLGLNKNEIASKLKVHPFRVELALKNKEFNKDTVLNYLDELCDIDYRIKSGKEDKFEALELFLLSLNRQRVV